MSFFRGLGTGAGLGLGCLLAPVLFVVLAFLVYCWATVPPLPTPGP